MYDDARVGMVSGEKQMYIRSRSNLGNSSDSLQKDRKTTVLCHDLLRFLEFLQSQITAFLYSHHSLLNQLSIL